MHKTMSDKKKKVCITHKNHVSIVYSLAILLCPVLQIFLQNFINSRRTWQFYKLQAKEISLQLRMNSSAKQIWLSISKKKRAIIRRSDQINSSLRLTWFFQLIFIFPHLSVGLDLENKCKLKCYNFLWILWHGQISS